MSQAAWSGSFSCRAATATARASGSVELDVRCQLRPGPQRGERLTGTLVVRRRGSDQELRPPTAALTTVEQKETAWHGSARLGVVLEDAAELAEGIWDFYVEVADESGRTERTRLAATRIDDPDNGYAGLTTPGGDHRFLPYVSRKGNLSVLVAGLRGHVEVERLWARDLGVEVVGRLVEPDGTLPPTGTGLTGVARLQDHDAEATFDVELGPGTGRLTGRLDLHTLAAVDVTSPEPRVWELAVRGAGRDGDVRELRLATYTDDIRDKAKIITFPDQLLESGDGVRLLRPRYDGSNRIEIVSEAVGS